MYSAERERLLNSLEASHEGFYTSGVFGGPSLHFHLRALAEARARSLPGFVESSYAMLASWGMHRMGRGGAKMDEFSAYEASVHKAWPMIMELQAKRPAKLTELDWSKLKDIFVSVKAMRSSFSLVATSKVLAHALPNLIPPVDRRYTIKFLCGSRVLPKHIEGEWILMRGFLESFFYPILQEQKFATANAGWRALGRRFPWDTSSLKTIDNVLIGYVRTPT